MKKKLLSILAILSLVLSLMPASAVFAIPSGSWGDEGAYDVSWYGDGSASGYTISNPAALAGLAYLVNSGATFENKTVTLGADISLSGKSWKPIGTDVHPFKGLFNGAGYAITGMTVYTAAPCIGFFGLADSAMLLNISLSGGIHISYNNDDMAVRMGGIAGEALGTVIENCSYRGDISFHCSAAVSAEIPRPVYVGGIAGFTNTELSGGFVSFVTNCSMVGNITVSSAMGRYDGKAGGLVGEAFATDILNCCHIGDVTSNLCWDYNYAGGLAGELVDNSSLKNCYTEGTATAAGAITNGNSLDYLGFGAAENIYTDNAATPNFVTAPELNDWISSSGSDACRPWRDDTESENGGLPVFADTAWQVALSGNGAYRTSARFSGSTCRYFETHYVPKGGSLSLPNDAYSLKFYALTGWGTSRSGSAVCTGSATPSGDVLLYALWQESPVVPYRGQAAAGKYSISTATQLANLSVMVAVGGVGYMDAISGSIFTLTADIDLSKSDSFDLNGDGDTLDPGETWAGGTYWSPIGSDTAKLVNVTFLGGGHMVTGMTIVNPAAGSGVNMGLFGYLNRCTIDSLYVGGSITLSTGPQSLDYVYAGGLVGTAVRSTILNCGAEVDISVTYDNALYVMMGGLAGYLNADTPKSTLNCYATGALTLSGAVFQGLVGGIAGGVRVDDVRNCYFAGSILCTATLSDPVLSAVHVGGITGYLRGGILTNCYYLAGSGISDAAGFRILTPTVEGCGTFAGNTGTLTPLPGQTLLGTTLLGALNAWITAQPGSGRYSPWYVMTSFNAAYPQFVAPPAPISDTGDGGVLPLTLGLWALAALSGATVLVSKRRRG